jgi:putative mRNA 3-end processing factor
MSVRLRDGVELLLSDGTRVVCDADRPDGDVNVVSHAHGDHVYEEPPATVVCSELTLALATARRDDPADAVPTRVDDDRIRQVPAGHVAGSRATYVDDGATTYCYTGDCSVRDRAYLSGFDPDPADVLVVEATYGDPDYRFPPQADLEATIVEELAAAAAERPLVLFGYSLGRAQKLQLLADEAGLDVYVTPAVERVNGVVEAHLPVRFPAEPYRRDDGDGGEAGDPATRLEPGTALVAPSQASRSRWVASLVERTDALTVGFSGWAVDSSFRFRGGYDEAFVLSDHADFDELVSVVEAVDPERVYTTHGSADALARHLTNRGWDARSLKRNQSSLGEF